MGPPADRAATGGNTLTPIGQGLSSGSMMKETKIYTMHPKSGVHRSKKGPGGIVFPETAPAPLGRNALEAYLQDLFNAGEAPFQTPHLIVVTHVIEYLRKEKNINVTHRLVFKLLREAGADSIGQKRIADGTRPNVWALRDAERWKNVEESVVAQFYRGPNAPVPTDHERKMLKEGIELALK